MLSLEGLTKRFDTLTAVDDLSLEVAPGEVLGLLGPNGAGKSTTMKMVTGFLVPTRGSARICGHDVAIAATTARRSLGYLPEGAPAWGEMTPRSFLRFVAHVRGLRGGRRRERLAAVIAQLELEPVLEQPVQTLSKGFKRRVGLAQALLHDPPVLIMDEPTDGLDPNQKHQVRRLIRNIAGDKTIVISTHILEEVESVCSRAAIINHGRLIADDTPAGLLRRSRYRNAVQVSLQAPAAEAADALRTLASVGAVEAAADGQTLIVFGDDGVATAERIRGLCLERGWRIEALRVEGGRLDDVFRDITQGEAA